MFQQVKLTRLVGVLLGLKKRPEITIALYSVHIIIDVRNFHGQKRPAEIQLKNCSDLVHLLFWDWSSSIYPHSGLSFLISLLRDSYTSSDI
jgi:hypothetical protein